MGDDQTIDPHIAMILRRHPDGVTLTQLIGGLVGRDCKHSEAQQRVRSALSDGQIRVGWAGRLYTPKEDHNGR